MFSRPYPPATAGTPVSLHYDTATRIMEYAITSFEQVDLTLTFRFSYQPNLQILSPTELYIPGIIEYQNNQPTLSYIPRSDLPCGLHGELLAPAGVGPRPRQPQHDPGHRLRGGDGHCHHHSTVGG